MFILYFVVFLIIVLENNCYQADEQCHGLDYKLTWAMSKTTHQPNEADCTRFYHSRCPFFLLLQRMFYVNLALCTFPGYGSHYIPDD